MGFGFWVLRYLFTFVMFILGIKAPGISTVRDYYSRYSDAEVSNLIIKTNLRCAQFYCGNGEAPKNI